MNKYLVVIPYCSDGAQGREIEYAVAGWRKHFKEDYLIVLAGENHPVTGTGDDICCVESQRVNRIEGQSRQHLDYVSCLKKVHSVFPDTNGYIMVADDVYAVNDFDFADVRFLKSANGEIFSVANPFNIWEVDKVKTRKELLDAGYPIHNYTTHLPEWYEWDKVHAIWERFHMDEISHTIEDLYYNIYFKDRIPFKLNDDDNLKAGFYDIDIEDRVLDMAFERKIWITNSPEGWCPKLEERLKQHYGI